MGPYRTIKELQEAYRQGWVSPEEIAEDCLTRIETADGAYRSVITVTGQSARRQAQAAGARLASGDGGGALLGVPVTYKDNVDTAGIRTTNGSHIDRERVPSRNAAVVDRLEAAGAVAVGKANLYEYAFGITSDNPFYGAVRNPWDVRYMAGGSSSGSAASVAAGFCLGSIGTDTAGSIRVPSSCCGVVGLKPTHGLIPADGVETLSWTLDHVGPIAGSVADVALLLEAAAGRSYARACRADIRGMRIGVPRGLVYRRIEPAVRALFDEALAALAELGAVLVDVELPLADRAIDVAVGIATPEVGYVHRERIAASLALYGDGAADTFARSRAALAHEYMDAMRLRAEMTSGLDALFGDVDAIVTPTMPAAPTLLGQEEVLFPDGVSESVHECMIRFTCLYNVTGHPALSVPCGLTPEGLPAGLQIAAARHCEETALHVAYAYEQAALPGFYAERESRLKRI
ncbi:amidase [Cohnella sp. JJ-181]|uniref:amidase n=1 Tax=Cohnella rhizoplanae TaxID=2974897 RepID=UPI0022FFA96F|nr:amidase [Cohnella sp. JJ-181]CAI6075713.1 Glutamyl-tRNA(Gln) amidotransferase subunit A [Cohnella sp. JJ-181]